ncbi:sensor domain-containing diguanylate cyclase [Marinicella meishanensis]|uniref:sensor domain-containing diguanylate cyclase n=1 Tax=Marinicella meishanensis TaxID=2873263 RepID=UPI001CC0D20D|nr:diguanylate cyclase [Marinicella sp. NBU2979]
MTAQQLASNRSDMTFSDKLSNTLSQSMVLRTMVLFVAWLAVWQAGRLVEYTNHASVWFPVSGFTFACFMVLGRRAALPIMAGAIVITIWQIDIYQIPLSLPQSAWAGFLFGLAHMVPYWLGAHIIVRLSLKENHSAPQLIVTFLVVAGITAFVVTTLVISSLVFTDQMPRADVQQTLLPFFIGDMAGVVVLAPLFSGVLLRFFPDPNMNLNEFVRDDLGSVKSLIYKMSLNVALIILTMLLAFWIGTQESSFAIFFLAVTHMWIACTESPKFNVVSLAVSSVLIALLVNLLGLMDHVMVYQFAINVIAANALFGIAIPQLKAYNRELEIKVQTDALTQVSSRPHMEQRAEAEIANSHAQQTPLSLVVFDLDDFKQINDQYGHPVGDQALQQVSDHAKNSLRKNDVIARFGGDEFVLLLPDLSSQEATLVIQRIQQAVSEIIIGETTLAGSFGIAQLSAGEDFHQLFMRADQALYTAKQNGGNQISIADPTD